MNVLITGARALVALDLARKFQAEGHRVFCCDSITPNMCSFSNAVKHCYSVRSPRFDIKGFTADVVTIVRENDIQLIIPTCEEVFHLAKIKGALPATCEVFCGTIEQQLLLHNKYDFVQFAEAIGVGVPSTKLISNSQNLQALVSENIYVFKPTYSRFAAKTQFAGPHDFRHDGFQTPWVAQEVVHGQEFCSYSVVREGEITAHVIYPAKYRAGRGANLFFESIEHDGITMSVRKIAKSINLTGQIAFDFIQEPSGRLVVIECNPRATSGIHLFTESDKLCEAFLLKRSQIIKPQAGARSMLGLGLVMVSGKYVKSLASLKTLVRDFASARDAVFSFRDIIPYFAQLLILIIFAFRSFKGRCSLLESMTLDIEWNG